MTPRRLLTAAVVAALALAGCASAADEGGATPPPDDGAGAPATDEGGTTTPAGDDSAAPAAAGETALAMVIKPLDNTYFGAMAQGAQDAADEAGVALDIVAAQNVTDDSGQANKLNALVTAGKDCYIVNPTSPTNLLTGLAPVSAEGTPIVNLDLPIDLDAAEAASVDVTTYVGTNNETAGQAGGEAMMELLDDGDQVALIGGLAADPGSIGRLAGFEQAVDGTLEITQTVAADFDKAKAKSSAATIIRGNPDIDGFFTPSGDMALGIQQAVDEAGMDDQVAVVGVDGTEAQLQDIIDGGQPAAIEQFPYLMGVQSVQACLAALDGQDLPANVETPVLIVDEANAQEALDVFPQPPASFEVPNPFE